MAKWVAVVVVVVGVAVVVAIAVAVVAAVVPADIVIVGAAVVATVVVAVVATSSSHATVGRRRHGRATIIRCRRMVGSCRRSPRSRCRCRSH